MFARSFPLYAFQSCLLVFYHLYIIDNALSIGVFLSFLRSFSIDTFKYHYEILNNGCPYSTLSLSLTKISSTMPSFHMQMHPGA